MQHIICRGNGNEISTSDAPKKLNVALYQVLINQMLTRWVVQKHGWNFFRRATAVWLTWSWSVGAVSRTETWLEFPPPCNSSLDTWLVRPWWYTGSFRPLSQQKNLYNNVGVIEEKVGKITSILGFSETFMASDILQKYILHVPIKLHFPVYIPITSRG